MARPFLGATISSFPYMTKKPVRSEAKKLALVTAIFSTKKQTRTTVEPPPPNLLASRCLNSCKNKKQLLKPHKQIYKKL